MKSPLVSLLIETAQQSADSLKSEISDIKLSPYVAGQTCEKIQFTFRGRQYIGELKGRNRDLLIGFGIGQDKAGALRVILDGHISPMYFDAALTSCIKKQPVYTSENRPCYLVTYSDGNTVTTEMNCDLAEATAYFKSFDRITECYETGKESAAKCISVSLLS